ncbi:MAG: hypothetical protein V4727_07390 [Verrucomicrobiota bacterium]
MKITLNRHNIPLAAIPEIEKMLYETAPFLQIKTNLDESKPEMFSITHSFPHNDKVDRPDLTESLRLVSTAMIGKIRKIICQHRFALKMQSAT